MNLLVQVRKLISTGFSTGNYYKSMNEALKRINDEYTMLHYPLFNEPNDDFLQAQNNLTDFCVSLLGSLKGKRILEIGCGNGVQAKYILRNFEPACITGVDLNPENIRIANEQKALLAVNNAYFFVDDAQKLTRISDNSFDVVVNIESAFHYPDKDSFLREVARVLKPGGYYVIADITTTGTSNLFSKRWKGRMILHHWERKMYLDGLMNANLHILHHIDITQRVIEGFRNYRNWFRKMKKQGFISDLAFKIFYFINVQINIYLLKTRRRYLVFAGVKPHPGRV